MLPEDRLVIDIKNGKNIDERTLHISGHGPRYEELIKELE